MALIFTDSSMVLTLHQLLQSQLMVQSLHMSTTRSDSGKTDCFLELLLGVYLHKSSHWSQTLLLHSKHGKPQRALMRPHHGGTSNNCSIVSNRSQKPQTRQLPTICRTSKLWLMNLLYWARNSTRKILQMLLPMDSINPHINPLLMMYTQGTHLLLSTNCMKNS